MKMSSLSMAVFAIYLGFLGVAFIAFPNPVIAIFGFPETQEVWIRILGYVLGALSFYYIMAIREDATHFYRWTVYGRLPIFPVFSILTFLGITPPVILLFATFDTGCALWTGLALRKETPAN